MEIRLTPQKKEIIFDQAGAGGYCVGIVVIVPILDVYRIGEYWGKSDTNWRISNNKEGNFEWHNLFIVQFEKAMNDWHYFEEGFKVHIILKKVLQLWGAEV